MGRPPCCDKVGIKKGPWTPEEDIVLVSYIQEHGPGNWRSVPTNTGLSRCSKSCRLRWTNYLRPGIKRGNFTPHEEGMIIHLQALLGNKWAAIASYLPQRTDNDIKNYWNTHLKKKLKRFQSSTTWDQNINSNNNNNNNNNNITINAATTNSFGQSSSTLTTTTFNNQNSSCSSTYASSTENISRLLEGWMRSSPKPSHQENNNNNNNGESNMYSNGRGKFEQEQEQEQDQEHKHGLIYREECELIKKQKYEEEDSSPPLSFIEKWLFDETNVEINQMMEFSHVF